MALPTLAKVYQFALNLSNTPSGSSSTDAKAIWVLIKAARKAFGLNPWTVLGSSDGTTAALDGVDRLPTAASILAAASGSNHSWIVMQQTGVGASFSVCYNWISTTHFDTIVSPSAGFTGGTRTARPTATDEYVWTNNFMNNNPGQFRAHVIESTDGSVNWLFVCYNGNPIYGEAFFKAANIVTGWTNPVVHYIFGGGGTECPATSDIGNLFGAGNWKSRSPANTLMELYGTIEGFPVSGGSAVITTIVDRANDISGEFPLCPIGLCCTTATMAGRHGQIPDAWVTTPTVPQNGDTLPQDGSKLFAIFGVLVVPWDAATVPLVG